MTGVPLKKREMHFTHIITNSLLQKFDEVRYIANITNASIIEISETKLDGTIWSSEFFRQRRKSVIIFNDNFCNVRERRINVINMTIWKK